MVAANLKLDLANHNVVPVSLSRRATLVIDNRPQITAEDIRIHSWINERLTAIHRERNSLRAKMSRFLFGEGSL